jgi:NADH:ubiquinone oxidoreductase subunit F (NADH-binding)
VYVAPLGVFYVDLTVDDVGPIVRRTLGEGEILDDLTLWDAATGRHIPLKQDVPFLRLQTRRLMRSCGEVDPRRIEDSLRRGGYSALALALEGMATEDIAAVVEASGLRGRGETDAPCAERWAAFTKASAARRRLTAYVKRWDTAAATDCTLLEGDPHLVLEGMALAALATGCEVGQLLVPPGRDVALATMEEAIEQACAYGLLGENILGTRFSFTVEVCASRPLRWPTENEGEGWSASGSCELRHNVETLANLPGLVARGAAEFRSVGPQECPGTRLVSLGGDLRYRGVVEVPCGTPVVDIIEKLGGGGKSGESPQGVCLGGPAGRILPMSLLARTAYGVGPDAADVVAFENPDSVVSRVRQAAAYEAEEACGRCAPCRIGTKRVVEILDELLLCEGSPSAVADLRGIGEALTLTAGCDQGAHCADSVLSAIASFEETFLAHLSGGPCPSPAREA